ncbi:hypothetical protein [Arthrobacter nitrophenolicus]|uniref:hypothetical protein n=1 Tax=Arthrobacter nitrophenolicus TaxID=683150 RepID=UPI001404D60B|nr:hypothetical protein [Arthrobacter nitrophenolicus]
MPVDDAGGFAAAGDKLLTGRGKVPEGTQAVVPERPFHLRPSLAALSISRT